MKVFIMDLLCQTPYYDKYLCEALQKRINNVTLGACTFRLDNTYLKRSQIKLERGLIDIVAKFTIQAKVVRQCLRCTEYLINLAILYLRFLFNKPDIVHVQWIPLVTKFPIEIWFLSLLKRRGITIVYTVHDLLPHDTGLAYKSVYRQVYTGVNALICHSQQVKNSLVKDFDIESEKIWVIPHGPLFHDGKRMSCQSAKSKLGFSEQETIVLFSGLIRPYKGIEFLLRAWKEATKFCLSSRLVLAGQVLDEHYANKIKSIIEKLNIADSVFLKLEYISIDDLTLCHQAADILVYPYEKVTTSGALLTGMTFGKPIIATDIEGFREILNDEQFGNLIKYGDTVGFASELQRLSVNPEIRKECGDHILKSVEKYSWHLIAENTIQCYETAKNTYLFILGTSENNCNPADNGTLHSSKTVKG